MSEIKESALELIGGTPILKLNRYAKKREITDVRSRLAKAGNTKFFVNERKILLTVLDSLQTRENYIYAMDSDSKVRELFLLTENQIVRNIRITSVYIMRCISCIVLTLEKDLIQMWL